MIKSGGSPTSTHFHTEYFQKIYIELDAILKTFSIKFTWGSHVYFMCFHGRQLLNLNWQLKVKHLFKYALHCHLLIAWVWSEQSITDQWISVFQLMCLKPQILIRDLNKANKKRFLMWIYYQICHIPLINSGLKISYVTVF